MNDSGVKYQTWLYVFEQYFYFWYFNKVQTDLHIKEKYNHAKDHPYKFFVNRN